MSCHFAGIDNYVDNQYLDILDLMKISNPSFKIAKMSRNHKKLFELKKNDPKINQAPKLLMNNIQKNA